MDSDGSPQRYQTVSAWRPEVRVLPVLLLTPISVQGDKTNEQETKPYFCSPGCGESSNP